MRCMCVWRAKNGPILSPRERRDDMRVRRGAEKLLSYVFRRGRDRVGMRRVRKLVFCVMVTCQDQDEEVVMSHGRTNTRWEGPWWHCRFMTTDRSLLLLELLVLLVAWTFRTVDRFSSFRWDSHRPACNDHWRWHCVDCSLAAAVAGCYCCAG